MELLILPSVNLFGLMKENDMSKAMVSTGKPEYLRRKYSDMLKSQFWKQTKVKQWSDGAQTVVFEYVGEDD